MPSLHMRQARSCSNAARRVLQPVLSTIWSYVLLRVPGAGTTCIHRPMYARYILRLLPVVLGIVGPTTAGGRSQGSRPHLVREGLYPMPNMNRMPYLCAGALDTFLGICTCIGSQRRCFLSKPRPVVCWHPSCPGQHILGPYVVARAIPWLGRRRCLRTRATRGHLSHAHELSASLSSLSTVALGPPASSMLM